MRTTRLFLAILGTLLLTACGSSPQTHFYTLSVVPGRMGHPALSTPVQLSAVHIPPSLDRREMISMIGPNSVQVSQTDRWSAAFGLMVRNVLSQDLVARLPGNKVILPDAPAPAGTGTLVVTLAQFGPDANGRIKLSGSWALLSGSSGATVLERYVQLDAGPAPDAGSRAAAMSRILGQLASQMATAVSKATF
jgi:uncharacterized lipoprotein YmbA